MIISRSTFRVHSYILAPITLNNQSATTPGTTAYYELYDDGNYSTEDCDTSITKITVPTKTGYNFNGYWTKTGGQGTQYVDKNGKILSGKTTFTANTTLYADWDPIVYTITLNNQGANSAGTTAYYEHYQVGNYKEQACTNPISSITKPVKTGYTFGGYYTQTNGNGTPYVDATGKITSNKDTFKTNITLYAKWTANPTTPPTVTPTNTMIPLPVYYQVTYKYYKENSSGNWEEFASEKDPTLIKSGETLAYSTISGKSDSKYEAEKNGELKGYGLKSAICKGTMSGEEITSDLTITSNITICIGYSNSSNKLVIDVKGGEYNTALSSKNKEDMNLTFTYGSVKNFSSNDIANYVTGGMSLPTKAYNHLYGDTSYVVSSNERYRYDASYANAKGIDSKYRTYWTIVQGDSTGSVINNGGNYAFNGQSLSNVTIQANWIPNQYQVKLDLQGGTYDGKINGESMYNDTLVEYYGDCWGFVNLGYYGVTLLSGTNPGTGLNGNNVQKEGHVFGGFYTGINGTGDQIIDANGKITAETTKFTEDTTIYAYWTKGFYPVTCYDVAENASGTVLGTHTENFAYGTTVNGSYWGSDRTLGAYYKNYSLINTTSAVVTTNGATVYRIFHMPTSGLNINPNGGTWRGISTTVSITGKHPEETEYINDPDRNPFTARFYANGGTYCEYSSQNTIAKFLRWSKSSPFTSGTLDENTKIFTFGTTENGNGTLTAQWDINNDIKFPNATWAGHDLVGWYTAPNGGSKKGNAGQTITISQNETFYAQWKAHPTKITLSNTVDKSKVCFAKGNPVAVFKVEGTDVMGDKHTFIKTLKWDTSSNNYQSLSFTILSGNYTVTLLNQNEYTVGTSSGTSNVTASGTTASVNMSDGSEATVNFTTSETDYSKYTGNSLVTTSLK